MCANLVTTPSNFLVHINFRNEFYNLGDINNDKLNERKWEMMMQNSDKRIASIWHITFIFHSSSK